MPVNRASGHRDEVAAVGGAQESPIEENQSTVHRGDSGRYEVGTPDVAERPEESSKAKHSGLRTLRKSLSRVVSFSDFSTLSDDKDKSKKDSQLI